VSRTIIARWAPDQGAPPGAPDVRLRPATGCRLPQDPPIRGKVVREARQEAFRRGRAVPRGGRRNLLRTLGPWVRAYYSRPT